MITVQGAPPLSQLDERISNARQCEQMSLSMLRQALDKIGMVRTYQSDDPQSHLLNAIQQYVHDAVRVEVLSVMSREDFYLAIAHSASKMGEI